MNVSTFTDKKMDKMNVSQAVVAPADTEDKSDLLKGAKLKIKTRKKINLSDQRMDFSSVEATPPPDDEPLIMSPSKLSIDNSEGERRATEMLHGDQTQ
mmetsp:Transcript_35897/g.55116  ORF Transcript_35897/g.55116 Transcript_35897/m.55116 type:complete len:98 (-) Transcript_35897:738-1031(-)